MEIVPTHPWVCPVTVGRQSELARIRDRLQQSSPGVVLVAGEAGIGKSRLVRDAMAEAARLEYSIIWGHSFEADAGLPFAPLSDALRSLIAVRSGAEIVRLAGPYATSLARLLPELSDTIGPDAPAVEPVQDKRRLFEALDSVFAGLTVATPVVVVVEDLHWSDAASLEFLLFLARRSTGRPLSLLGTYRDDEVGSDLEHFLAGLDRERLGIEVHLTGLEPSEMDTMIRAIFGLTRPAPAEVVHLLSTLTEGNPFFIEEVLTSMGAAGARPDADENWAVWDADKLRIPRSVQDAVRRRSVPLDPAARRVLELAAVAGRRFSFSLLQELTGVDETSMLDSLKDLVAAQLIVEESDDDFAFRHALTRQAVYMELLTRERQGLHRVVADALERSRDTVGDARLSDLAYHYFTAGAWDKALAYARRAGDHAMALYSPGPAILHYHCAMAAAEHLSFPPEPDLARARGSAYEVLGEFERARSDYEAARDLARSAGKRMEEAEALISLGLLWSARDYARAGDAIQEAVDVARKTGDIALIARCLNRLGNWHLNSERPLEAQRCHREALTIVEGLGDRRGVAETLDFLGIASFLGADLDQGTEHCTRAVEAWRALGDRRGLASSLIALSIRTPTFHTDTLPAPSGHAEALTDVEEALGITRAIGWRAGESWALWTIGGMNLATLGVYARAFETTRAALAIAEEIEHRQWQSAIHCMLGNMTADLLAYRLARQHLSLALALARESNAPYWERNATGFLASAVIAQSDLAGAEAIVASALAPGMSMESLAQRVLWRAAAELALAQDDPEHALWLADRLVASAPGASADRPIARLEKLRGEAMMALGRTEEAENALQRARDTSVAQGTRPLLWRTHVALGRLYQLHSHEEEAERSFGAASALIHELAQGVSDEALRTGFLAAATAVIPATSSRPARRTTSSTPGGLTAREREVAHLVTRGLSNREIAGALSIADWTAATHVRNILAKLGLRSRTQIAAWAVEHGLADREA